MNRTQTMLGRAVKSALALGTAGSLLEGGAVLARAAAPAAGTAAGATQLNRIMVTGTHIPRASIATAQPIISITREQIDATGFTTVGQLLQNLSAAGSAMNAQFNNSGTCSQTTCGGTGQVFVNLHDLGPKRVLVLVNGQRWISTLGGEVDLSTIPLSIVDHVEVLLDGASAVYGSDAIAGVINIITQKNYNGAAADAYVGMYDAHGDGGGWDGKNQQYSFTVGTSGDRSSVLLSIGYNDQQPVWAGQRTISKEPYIGTGNLAGSIATPGADIQIVTPSGHSIPHFPGCGPSGYYGSPGCNIAGPMIGPNADPHPFTVADQYNFAPANYLLTPSEGWDIYSQGHYDLARDVSFHFTTTYVQRNSAQLLAPNPWSLGVYGDFANGGLIGISSTNPYNPFGQDLVPAYYSSSAYYQPFCSRYGTGAAPGTCTSNWQALAYLAIRPLKIGYRYYTEDTHTFYFNGGFNGTFQLGGNEWNWNADYIYGQTFEADVYTGVANTARMQTALGPLSGCEASPECVPLDVFGGASQMTPPMLKYVGFTAHYIWQQNMRDYNASVAGNFWNSWYAGPWGAAAGYEYDEMDGSYSPDALISEGNTTSSVYQPSNGRENTNAQYVELNIPLASDVPLAKELSVDLANRWSQFQWAGIGNLLQGSNVVTGFATGRAHSSTGRVALKWRPVDQLLLRGSWSQGFRIPSISELFTAAEDVYPTVHDPCAPNTRFGGWVPGTLLPPGCPGYTGDINTQQPDRQPLSEIRSAEGGSAQLQPEKSQTRSIGFVYSPTWAPGLDLGADYYKAELVNMVSTAGSQYYLDQCYIKQNANACSRIVTRANNLIVSYIVNLTDNVGTKKVEGWDVNFRYALPTTPVGQFTVNGTLNFTREDVQCFSTGECVDYAGNASGYTWYAQPKHRYNFSVSWNYGPWAAAWNIYVIGPMWENCSATGLPVNDPSTPLGRALGDWCSNPEKDQNHLGTTVYNDLQGSYTVSSWNTTFTLGVNNLFDKEPPISRSSYENSYLAVYYRVPGRFFYGRVSVNF